MIAKYELTDETRIVYGHMLHRIRAVCDIPRHGVKSGDLGGWVEAKSNLPQDGDAWVFGEAKVFGDAEVFGGAEVYGNAWVFGEAKVYGNAQVFGESEVRDGAHVCDYAQIYDHALIYDHATVCGDAEVAGGACVCGDAVVSANSDYMVFRNVWSSDRWFTYTRSNDKWCVGCFYGTGEELIKKAYADSEAKGRCYEATVRYAEQIYSALKKEGDEK